LKQIGKTLYAANKDGSAQQWSVFVDGSTITVEYGKHNGKLQTKQTICESKNVGKVNETTPEQQATLEAESKYRDQIRKGYVESIDDVSFSTDKTRVMLAQDASKKPHFVKYPCHTQPKLDGCFTYATKVLTNIGLVCIGDIVENKMKLLVLSYNEKTEKLEYKKITNYFNNGLKQKEEWLRFDNNAITKNHKILTDAGWKPYGESNHMLSPNPKYLGIVCGMLLGDSIANIEKRNLSINTPTSWRLDYNVGGEDFQYGLEKSKLLKDISYRCRDRLSGYNKPCQQYVSTAMTNNSFPLSIFYTTDKTDDNFGRRVTIIDRKLLESVFTDESLALWYFDDGSLHYNNGNKETPRMFLSVARYSDETIEGFVELFKKKYNVTPSLGYYGKDKRLSFNTKDSTYLFWKISRIAGNLLPRKIPEGFSCGSIEPQDQLINITIEHKNASLGGLPQFAFDIEVEDNHNYFANNKLVHNCRSLITFDDNGEPVFNSRGAKVYPKHEHLAEQLKQLRLETGFDSFDGELYVHGLPLQKIVSLVKKVQPDSSKLEYRIYDIPSEKVWSEREKDLTELSKHVKLNISTVPVTVCNNEQEAKESIHEYMEQGYEGTILRNMNGKYEFGQRSNDLLKWKVFESDEALVYDAEIDKNGEGVLLCKMQNGTEFRCKMKGTHEERLYEEQLKLVGKYITFTYQTLTVDGVPQFPVGISVRELNENWEPLE